MSQPLVYYLVARAGLPPRSGLVYDYIVAGDGVFLSTANAWLELRVPVAACDIRGLQPIYAACILVHDRLPAAIWEAILACLRVAHMAGHEALVGVRFDGHAYRLVLPRQVVSPISVRYTQEEDLVLEVHSHRDGPARFSMIDDHDEQQLRLYGVVGRLDSRRSQVALRAGAYGLFLPVSWTSIFEGDAEAIDDVLDGPRDPVAQDPLGCAWDTCG